MEQLPLFNRLISQPNGLTRNYAGIMQSLAAFNDWFSSPQAAEEDSGPTAELKPLLTVIGGAATSPGDPSLPVEMEAAVATALKILLRKAANRDGIGKFGVKCMVHALARQTQRITPATAEVGNATLNACYDGANVAVFLELGGLPHLLYLLRSRDCAVQGSVLGAIQSLCFVPIGRRALLDDESVCPDICF